MESYVRGRTSTRDSVNLHTVTVRRYFGYCRKEVIDVYMYMVHLLVCEGVREKEMKGERGREGEGNEEGEEERGRGK